MKRLVVSLICALLLLPSVGSAQESIKKYTEHLERLEGFFPLYWDSTEARLLLEIPHLGEEFLYLTSLATGLGSTRLGLDRGTINRASVARFERTGKKVFFVLTNPRFRALDTSNPALVRSVEESFPTSTVAAFDIVAVGENDEHENAVLVDATDYFLRDHVGVVGRLRRANQGSFSLNKDRSTIYIQRTKSFPANTEVEVSLTFTANDPGGLVRANAPDAGAITLRQHHSLVRLPDDGYKPRRGDPRIGVFGISFYDFSQPFDGKYESRYIQRHRLIKRDTHAPLSEPVQPIVYYLDSGMPEPYRTAIREGAMWWNKVFEAAGFKNAFRVDDMPDDMDPMDARYNVIQWVHRSDPGFSIGPSFVDPRTGEIIKAAVRMDTYRSLTDFNLYAGTNPDVSEPLMPDPNWLSSLDPAVSAEEFTMARRRQHAAHEVGHTLGLSHNFVAAADGRASVMDYPGPLIRLVGSDIDLSDAYRNGPGAYDSLAIRYAYTEFPPGEEERGLRAIIDEGMERRIRFNADGDNASWGSFPEVTQWTNGSDAVAELGRVMDVRRELIRRFDARAIADGQPMALLNKRFVPVYLHHRYALEAATKAVGGMEYRYAVRGDPLGVTQIIAPERQRRALEEVLDALEPDELAIPERVIELMAPRAFGESRDEWYFGAKAAPAFDQIGMARTLATMVIGNLLAPQRTARLVAFNARNGESPALEEVIARVIERTWGALIGGPRAPLRRVVQRVVVDRLIDLASNDDATVESRAAAEWGLRRISEIIQSRVARLPEEEAHQTLAAADIQRFLNRSAATTNRTKPLNAPPGTPIGGR
ncbi:MAG: zinc-dependent metalloprotease [Gemmatimonadales bacterium]